MQDIKQEGIDTTSPDVKVQAAIEEIKQEEAETKIEEENIELEQKEEQEKGEKKKSWWSFGKKKKGEKEEQIIITDIEKKENFFTKLANKLSTSKLKEEDFDDAFQDLEITLLENNTALEAVDKIRESLRASLVNKEIKKNKIQETIVQSLKDAILSVLIEPPNLIEQIKEKNKNNEPYVILFFGINGSGKTTSIAKLAHKLKKDGISSVLAAGDTFRAASIEQLKTHAEKINVPIIMHDYGGDPASVAFDTIKYAKQHKVDVVLIDTAGRMYTKTNLLKEMEKIVRVSKPDLKIFVGESITGNDVISQSQTFNDAIGIDGSILTKSDIDEKGGAILSVSYVTKKPIYYLGIGQGYDDLEIFNPRKVLEKLGL
ncbi:signal recognition particle-docking protein FtsY [Candidatus Pacearchaeota archaeon]|nr:signal recognition particle-docking protein FtsY [Candidatus Pacearchaeota archaeon]